MSLYTYHKLQWQSYLFFSFVRLATVSPAVIEKNDHMAICYFLSDIRKCDTQKGH